MVGLGSPRMAKYGYHVCSTSLPSTSHPLTAKVEEQLNQLSCWVALTSSSKLHTTKMLQDGFCGLIRLYESVEDLFQSPNTQQVLVLHHDQNCVDNLLDGSVILLDVSSVARDVLLQMKEHVHVTQSSLRRRRGKCNFRNEVDAYVLSRKKMNKVIKKCLGDLRKMQSKHSLSLLEKDHNLVAVVGVLREVEAITLSVFESLLCFMSGPRTHGRHHGWFCISKLMHNKRVICEEQYKNGNEIANADTVVFGLSNHKLCHNDEVAIVSNIQKQLEALEANIGSLEEGLDCVFRRLIKTRVSLLNILSN